MAKKLIFYRTKAACELQPDMEQQVVWVSFASALGGTTGPPQPGSRRYDWQSKVVFAANPFEALALAQAARMAGWGRLKGPCQLYHDPGKSERASGPPKALDLRPGEGTKFPAFLTLRRGEDRWDISLSLADLMALEMLLPLAVAAMQGWIAPGTLGFLGAEAYAEDRASEVPLEEEERAPVPPEVEKSEVPQKGGGWERRKDLDLPTLGKIVVDVVEGELAEKAERVLNQLAVHDLIQPDTERGKIIEFFYKVKTGQLNLN